MNESEAKFLGGCWLDDSGEFHREHRRPIYEEIECIDIERARWIRDNMLRMIRESRGLGDHGCRIMQLAADDLDFLIRGGNPMPESTE